MANKPAPDRLEPLTLVRLELERRRRALALRPLQEFIPAARPELDAPTHLARFTDFFERSLYEEVRALASTPPQHFKTTTATGALVWLAQRRPRRYMYITYSHERAVAVQQEALAFATGAGVSFKKSSQTDWIFSNGASIRWLGFDGAIGGSGVDGLVLVDDPYKGMEQARSEAVRRHVETAWRSIIWPRMHPGASVVMISTRWGLDDLFGTLAAETFPSGARWEVENLPAIDPSGRELLPCRPDCPPRCARHRPRWWLDDKRAGMDVYSWEAEYMGRPRPEGMSVFSTPRTYRELPARGLRWAVGFDMAYTEKTSADWSAAVVLAVEGDGASATYYVVGVVRGQVVLSTFAAALSQLRARHASATFFTFFGGQERTIIRETLNRPVSAGGYGLGVRGKPAAGGNKLSNAQAAALAWNAGRILVPETNASLGPFRTPGAAPEANVEWLGPFLREVGRFTGTEADKNDDQVDALVYAHFALSRGAKVAVLDGTKLSETPLGAAVGAGAQADLAFEALLRQQGL